MNLIKGQPKCQGVALMLKAWVAAVKKNSIIVPTLENGEELCIGVCFSFFLLFTQNQVPQKVIGLG